MIGNIAKDKTAMDATVALAAATALRKEAKRVTALFAAREDDHKS